MARNRTNFTDAQRATLYCLDKATCSFSGKNLWILDYGIDPTYEIDWADHIIPASKGGPSELENGATTRWSLNFARRNNFECKYLFRRGEPTSEYRPDEHSSAFLISSQLNRFSNLHPSDWYLNRALWHLWLACLTEYHARLGKIRTRRKDYYSSASAKALAKWQQLVVQEGVPPLETRGLIPTAPESDQEILYSARNHTTKAALLDIIHAVLESFISSKRLMVMVEGMKTPEDCDSVREFIFNNHHIPGRFAQRALQAVDQQSNELVGK